MEYHIHRLTWKQNEDKTKKKFEREWIPCKGTPYKIGDLTFYHVEFDGVFYLIDKRSGLSIGKGDTKRTCNKVAKEKLNEVGQEKFLEMVEDAVKRFGESPSWKVKATYNSVGIKE